MRKALWLMLLVVGVFSLQSAFADATTTTITGKALDPHGQPISGYVVFAKLGQTYQVTTATDSAGRFTLNVPTQASNNCWIVGGSPDEFYTQSGGGTLCSSGSTELHPFFRVRSQAPQKETYAPNLGKIPYHLEVYANSKTNPAPFEGDAMTWTLTYHSINPNSVSVNSEGVFPAPTAHLVSGGIWRYEWKVDLEPVVTKPTMIHVDWGRHSNFGQMMDCRMIFAGLGLAPRSNDVYTTGSTVTLTGAGFGTTQGKVVLEQTSSVTWVDPTFIFEWTDTRISFLLPLTVNSNAYVRVFRADGTPPWCMAGGPGLPTNKTPLRIKTI